MELDRHGSPYKLGEAVLSGPATRSRPALALFQPDIAQNTGACLRAAACFGVSVHLVHPAGFALTDKGLRRAALDYAERAALVEHADWAAFETWRGGEGRRLVALSTRGETLLSDFRFAPGDVLLMGRESSGLPADVFDAAEARLRIPIRPETRSLNVAVAAGIALYEALRQIGMFG